MRRFDFIEFFIMLATVVQWLVLATITGAIVGSGTSLFLHGLFLATDSTASVPLWMRMLLLPAGGLLNGLLLYYGYRINTTDLKDTLFAAVNTQAGAHAAPDGAHQAGSRDHNAGERWIGG